MEASQAGLSGGDAAQQQGQATEQGGEQQGQTLDALAQQLEQLQGGQEELRTFLTSNPWAQSQEGGEAEAGAEESADLDLSFLEDPALAPEQVTAQLGELINQTVQQRVEAATQPLTQQQQELQRRMEADALVQEFEELGDPDVAREIVNVAGQLADAQFPPQIAAQLKDSPAYWRLVYMAGRAAEAANEEEGAEAPGAAHLEGGGGAGAAGGSEVDLGEQIVNARRGASVLPF